MDTVFRINGINSQIQIIALVLFMLLIDKPKLVVPTEVIDRSPVGFRTKPSDFIWNSSKGCYEKYLFAVLQDAWYNPKDKYEWVTLEEYTEDSLNGGQSTGYFVNARLGNYGGELPEIGRSCDGRLYFDSKHFLFLACCSDFYSNLN